MRYTTLIVCLLIACASHAELTIFEVQRNLPLSDGEKVYHDYYVDGGVESGLKTGMVLTVLRRAPLFDYYRNREVSDLQLKVAKIKVIQVQDNLSVVRLKEEISHEDQPISDDHYIMIGDHLDFDSSPVASAVEVKVEASPEAAIPVPAAPVTTAVVAPLETPPATARIVVNSVDLTIDEPKKPEPTPAPAPSVPTAGK